MLSSTKTEINSILDNTKIFVHKTKSVFEKNTKYQFFYSYFA